VALSSRIIVYIIGPTTLISKLNTTMHKSVNFQFIAVEFANPLLPFALDSINEAAQNGATSIAISHPEIKVRQKV